MPSITGFGLKIVTGYPRFWRFIANVPFLKRFFNRLFINIIVGTTKPRPYPLSLWGSKTEPAAPDEYVSWNGLVDRVYTGRHLPPASMEDISKLPATATLAALFERAPTMQSCTKSSALFSFFAQWFTDSFLRTDPFDIRKNTSNHEIDLCQIYGLTASDTLILRSKRGGELKVQKRPDGEYPPHLFEENGLRVNEEFCKLSYIDAEKADYRQKILTAGFDTPDRRSKLFATGLERGNSTIFYSAINTIFIREHNRIAREIIKQHPDWADDDDRVFELSRNANIACLLKIIVEDYINHLAATQLKFALEVGFAERQRWYRTNRICAEFNLLYRWHPLVPTTLLFKGEKLDDAKFRFNNDFLIKNGVEDVIHSGASQRGGRITLRNTAPFLVAADLAALEKSRQWRIRPYNDYRKCFGLEKLKSFDELTDDPVVSAQLEKAYGSINDVDLLVGLFAEKREPAAVLGELMTLMVGVDAFSQALTNPLLSQNVYGEQAFSDVGLDTIAKTSTFHDIVSRNSIMKSRSASFATDSGKGDPVPGRFGPPVLKTIFDTVDFFLFSGWENFFHRRRKKYKSDVFKINLFQPTVAVLDHDAILPLFGDVDLVQDYGFSWAVPPLPLVGHVPPSIFGFGAAHDGPKSLYMKWLRVRGPELQSVFDTAFRTVAERWVSQNRFSWADEIENFSVSILFQWLLGQQPNPGDVRKVYNNIFTLFATPIMKYVPGSTYKQALNAYARLLAFVEAAPLYPEILKAARAEGLSEESVPKQIIFLLGMNAFLGTQCLLKSIVGELTLHQEWRDLLAAELTYPGSGDSQSLYSNERLDRTLREILRLHPPVTFIFGRAIRDRTLASGSATYAIHENDLVMGVLALAQRDRTIFSQPDTFNPDRFADAQASNHLIWPRGLHDGEITIQDRTCPGKDVAVLLGKLFLTHLLNYQWELEQQPRWNRKKFSLNVAAPEGNLATRNFRRC